MIIFSVDTCNARGSVAVLRDCVELAVARHETDEDYSSWLMPTAEGLLREARLSFSEVGVYAVATGPGSFTGVRVGLTTIKGLAEVHRRRIAGISRLEALASLASVPGKWVASFFDAHRGQVFGGVFRKDGEALFAQGDAWVAAPEEFIQNVASLAPMGQVLWISPNPELIRTQSAWRVREDAGEQIQTAGHALAVRIGQIGYCRALEGKLVGAADLEANYVRRSDAEIFWKAPGKSAGHGS